MDTVIQYVEQFLAVFVRIAVALEKLAAKPVPIPSDDGGDTGTGEQEPPDTTPTGDLESVFTDDFATRPLNTEMPQAVDAAAKTDQWLPWVAGTGEESDPTGKDYASVQIVDVSGKRKLRCKIWNTLRRENGKLVQHSIGARAFIADYTRWIWWGTKFAGQTARIQAVATYSNAFTLPGGAYTFFQTFLEFKTLDTQQTAIGVFVEQRADGKLYHYLKLSTQEFRNPDSKPLEFGVPLQYEMDVQFKQTEDAKVIFRYKGVEITGIGRTLNKSNGQGGGAFVLYSNELENQSVAVDYEDIDILRLTA